jgi:hypothetical protein
LVGGAFLNNQTAAQRFLAKQKSCQHVMCRHAYKTQYGFTVLCKKRTLLLLLVWALVLLALLVLLV